jgi:undecaprenyl-diphosphatase
MTRHPTPAEAPLAAAAPAAVWRAWLRRLTAGARARLARASLLLAGVLLFTTIAMWVFGDLASGAGAPQAHAFDDHVLALIRQRPSPVLDGAARVFSWLGAEAVALLLVALLAGFARQRRWGAAVSLLVVTGGAQLLNNALKDHFQRLRPAPVTSLIPAQAWSFPSGHAMVAAAFYLFLAYLSWRLFRGWTRAVCAALLVAVVLGIGLARLYLGVHYPTDVVAGYAAGAAWTEAVVLAGRLLATRR